MQLAWRALIPISLAIVLMTALVVFVGGSQNDAYKAQQRVDGSMAAAMFLANVILMAVIMIASRILPAAPDTNRRMDVPHSRFAATPLPAQHVNPV
jgi:hypothetical protein